MNRYDIYAIHDGVQLTLRRGVAGDPRELAAASQTEADEWRRGCRVVVVVASEANRPATPEHIEL